MMKRIQEIFDRIYQRHTQVLTQIRIPQNRADRIINHQANISSHNTYFQIRINELYLSKSREWFTTYAPLVFTVAEFTYDNKIESVPFIVGPTLIEKYGQKAPQGMLFSNTRIAGLHPYRGGRITLSIVLCRVRLKNYAKELLSLSESIASVLDISTAFSTYLKISNVLLEGVESLFSLGDTQSLIGLRREFDPDAGDKLEASYFVFMDAPEIKFDPDKFWVRDNQLFYGSDLTSAKPFRETDYVLYSLVPTTERQDIALLPFYSTYEDAKAWASKPDDKSWQQAKASMATLYQEMVKSPDLIPSQVRKLVNTYVAEIRGLRKIAIGLGSLGATDEFDIGDITNISTTELLEKSDRIMALKL